MEGAEPKARVDVQFFESFQKAFWMAKIASFVNPDTVIYKWQEYKNKKKLWESKLIRGEIYY